MSLLTSLPPLPRWPSSWRPSLHPLQPLPRPLTRPSAPPALGLPAVSPGYAGPLARGAGAPLGGAPAGYPARSLWPEARLRKRPSRGAQWPGALRRRRSGWAGEGGCALVYRSQSAQGKMGGGAEAQRKGGGDELQWACIGRAVVGWVGRRVGRGGVRGAAGRGAWWCGGRWCGEASARPCGAETRAFAPDVWKGQVKTWLRAQQLQARVLGVRRLSRLFELII